MDPNQTIGTTPSRINNVGPIGSDSRTETLPDQWVPMGQPKQPRRNESLQSEPQTRTERQATIDPRHQTRPQFQIEPRSTTEQELESGIVPEKGKNSQRLLQQGLAHRSFSYSGLDEIETGLQGPQSTLIQSQNGYTERPGEPRTRIPPLSHPTSENRTPSATKTFQQTGFGDPI
uniref:Uncharacterized protein n=1 Tax=Brassica oleracea TaxID=3712 RepID=A0A3P6AXH7_BRAOL|nr:unnamed protein product [Brassica oleracea]